MQSKLAASSRVALAAYLHDLGKLAERAAVFARHPDLDAHLQTYCPFHKDGGWFSHRHAAHTAFAFDAIEPLLPDALRGDTYPFAGRVVAGDQSAWATDSLVNAAASHHKPGTFLQWIVATADRVASGFEREEFDRYNASRDERNGLNHYTSRQLSLFEQIRLDGAEPEEVALRHRYPLKPLAPANLFPALAKECESRNENAACAEYNSLWQGFTAGLAQIPASHRANLALWLDHFDSLWLTRTHAIPAATAFKIKPDVSLYDHSRATAALATALWRWHEANGQTDADAAHGLKARSDFDVDKLLLVQGDFFGIQDFVFATGGDTRKHAAKLLRGRSFQVSLFTELAALHLLDSLGLPPTSQIINAAGKFLIVAPNTDEVRNALEGAKTLFNEWFEKHSFGLAGIGLAWIPASCNDFLRKGDKQGFSDLTRKLIDKLEVAKYQRFDLCSTGAKVFTSAGFPHGPCAYNGRLPADRPAGERPASCAVSRDQIAIGEALLDFDRLLVVRAEEADALYASRAVQPLECRLFGYTLAFTKDEEISGRFGEQARNGALRRCWDFSPPADADREGNQPLWSGYARRFISGYAPRAGANDLGNLRDRYLDITDWPEVDKLKPFDMLACEDRLLVKDEGKEQWQGVAALGVLKGDVDNLGEIFRVGLKQPTFAKYASLSRQMNAFFAIWLPWKLARDYPSLYTVFAGGDDFFLIGPWRSTQRLAHAMQQEFARYVAGNPDIHFSAGIATQKPGAPIHTLAELAEDALGRAKQQEGKNAITCFGQTIAWQSWPALEAATARLGQLRDEARLSTGYVYGLLQFVDMRREEASKPQAAMWRPRFAYRTRRFVVDKMRGLDEPARQRKFIEIVTTIATNGIEALGANYRIVLFNHLYQFRDR